MRRFFTVCSFVFCFSINSFAICNQQMQGQFNTIVTTKNYNLSVVEPLYKECPTPSAEVIYYIAKAEEFQKENNIASALQQYNKALSTIQENGLEGFNDITLEIQNQIAKCQEETTISSEELDRDYILTRGDIFLGETRDAQLKHFEALKGVPINFKTGSSKIKKGVNQKQANEIGKILSKKYRDKIIYITGFTDTRGKASYNKTLSKNRAKSLKSYLVEKYHLKDNKIKIDGFGEKLPICESGYKQKNGNEYSCTGKENFYKGRRVTIEIGEQR